jgi:acetylornithine deacetylase/succinyl-diaminopimelate desuccinylase-like protein
VTDVEVRSASLNAVPDRFTIYIDRRTTLDETREGVIAQVQG